MPSVSALKEQYLTMYTFPLVPGYPVCPLVEALRAGLAFVTSPGTTTWQTFREEGQREKRGDAEKVS